MTRCRALPHSAAELEPLLLDENWCRTCVYLLRWPAGFSCPTCGTSQPGSDPAGRAMCRFCGKHVSLTAGTLMHGSKKDLSTWLRAAWMLCDIDAAPNIREMQQRLGLPSYQTAWTWMTKLRLAMQTVVRKKCTGTVQIDSAQRTGTADSGQDYVCVAALEYIAEGRSEGRARMSCCTPSPENITRFLDDCVRGGSVVIAPDREPFRSVRTMAHVYTVDSGRNRLSSVQKLLHAYSSWQTRRRYRPARADLLQCSLDEFTFYHNSRLDPGRLHTFENLLSALLEHAPVPVDKQSAAPGRNEVRHEH